MMWKTLAAVGIAVAASGAQAGVFIVTYTGTVSGYDPSNFFGLGSYVSPSPSAQFTLQFTVDPDKAGATYRKFPTAEQLSGEGVGANPIILSSFTLNGQTRTWGNLAAPTSGGGFAYRGDKNFGTDEVSFESHEYGDSGLSRDEAAVYLYSEVSDIVQTTNLAGALDYQVQADDSTDAYFRSYSADWTARYVNFTLRPTRVTIAPLAAPVPEPATWAMMLVGFGAVGLSLRRRTGERAAVAA